MKTKVAVGDTVTVLDLGSYACVKPSLPCKGTVKHAFGFYIIVEIGGIEWEVYEGGYSINH